MFLSEWEQDVQARTLKGKHYGQGRPVSNCFLVLHNVKPAGVIGWAVSRTDNMSSPTMELKPE